MELLYIIRIKTCGILTRLSLLLINRLREKSHIHSLLSKIYCVVCPFPSPLLARLDITTRCNFDCSFCYVKTGCEELSTSEVMRMISQLRNKSFRLSFLGGEPTLRKDLCRIIEFSRKRAHFREVTIYTNASLITKTYAEELRKSGLDSVITNFPVSDQKTFDRLTNTRGSFKRSMDGARNLVSAGIKTYTLTPITSENVNSLNDIERASLELGARPLFYKYIAQNASDPLMVDPMVWKAAKDRILERRPVHKRKIMDNMILFKSVCHGGRIMFSIKANGDITPCPFIDDIVIGNILQTPLHKMKVNKEMRDFLSVPEECKSCKVSMYCGGGCKADNPAVKRSYRNRDRNCTGPCTELLGKDIADVSPFFW